MTGMSAASHGMVGNVSNVPFDLPTLPGELRKAGYQTHLVGKLHFAPHRRRYGFDSMDWSDGPYLSGGGDYTDFLRREVPSIPEPEGAHGATLNSWIGRPWHLEDRLHFTNWATDRAMDFLERRDPTAPFFLKVSYFHPHTPCTPPQYYFDLYKDQDLGEPHIGSFSRISDGPIPGLPVVSKRLALGYNQMKQLRAGYFGCIHHLDDQIGRLLQQVSKDTLVVFVSDHGELLGDQQYFQKGRGFEGSARIPFLTRFPHSMDLPQGQVRDEPVELRDVMPTLLQAAGVPIPDTVEGKSLLPLIRGESKQWREYIHGEAAHRNQGTKLVPDIANHFLTDGRRKYIWASDTGEELFFDLEKDPNELMNLMEDSERAGEIGFWRQRLVKELSSRPEGFSRGGSLVPYGKTPPSLVDHRASSN